MPDHTSLNLKLVDGLQLAPDLREALQPGALRQDDQGRWRRLPRFFYEIDAWKTAREIVLAPHFGLYEFINVDLYEARVLQGFPRYVPCILPLLAAQLSVLRSHVGTYVHVAANGGYRSPSHGKSRGASTHQWGTAANIYRIGDDYLDDRETIEKYADLVNKVLPAAWIRPYGHSLGYADDHLHLDCGFATRIPREAAGEEAPLVDDDTR